MPTLPAMRRGTDAEVSTLAALRNLSVGSVRAASNTGFVLFGKWRGIDAWFVTDEDAYNAQARRLDGKVWEHIAGKAQTLPGCWASWPIGTRIAASYSTIMLCEGGPDLLAALHFIYGDANAEGRPICPVAMLGAAQRIHPSALPAFTDKRVRIYAHADVNNAGREAAERWAAKLITVGARVDIADFTGLRMANGAPIKDLNDCTSIHPDDLHELKGLLPE